jgi:glycosyltransferase involved in cell wall biosynthesis
MRLAYVCGDVGVPVFGRKGCSVHVQEVVRALVRQRVRVDLFAANCAGERPTALDRIQARQLPSIPKGDAAAREQAALARNPAINGVLEREGPFDFVYERYSLWNFAAMEYARDHGLPGLLEVNAPLIEEQAEHRTLVDRASALRVAKRVFRAATALLAVSSEVAAYLESFAETKGRVHVVSNGVDPGRFQMGKQPSRPGPPGTFTVGFVGSLKPWHGLGTLVEAFALLCNRHAGVRLLIVGDGPERESLETDIRLRGLWGAADLIGAVAPDEVAGLLASMDVGVAPYSHMANFYFSPMKVYEYMAAGLPVVASRLGQLAALIRPGHNGLLVAPGDSAGLADALAQLFECPELRHRMSNAARAEVLRDHTWDAIARRVLAIAGHRCGAPVAEGRIAL